MKLSRSVTVLGLALLLGACAHQIPKDSSGNDMAPGSTAYTLTNLHPDNEHMRLYSANYQQPGLIPRCTQITIDDMNRKRFVFTANGRQYTYEYHAKSTTEGFEANLQKYFGSKCDAGATKKLSAIDQKGIKEGKAYVGMSKQGILYAIGYPPESITPSRDGDVWKYWVHHFNTFNLEFTNGVVSKIVN